MMDFWKMVIENQEKRCFIIIIRSSTYIMWGPELTPILGLGPCFDMLSQIYAYNNCKLYIIK